MQWFGFFGYLFPVLFSRLNPCVPCFTLCLPSFPLLFVGSSASLSVPVSPVLVCPSCSCFVLRGFWFVFSFVFLFIFFPLDPPLPAFLLFAFCNFGLQLITQAHFFYAFLPASVSAAINTHISQSHPIAPQFTCIFRQSSFCWLFFLFIFF